MMIAAIGLVPIAEICNSTTEALRARYRIHENKKIKTIKNNQPPDKTKSKNNLTISFHYESIE